MRLPFLSLLALCFLSRTADGGEAQGPVPKVLEVTGGVDVAKLEKFAAVPGLTIQIDMRSETLPEPLVALLEGSLASNARWVALPATPTPLAIEQARRLRPARLIVTLGPEGLDPKLARRLKSLDLGEHRVRAAKGVRAAAA